MPFIQLNVYREETYANEIMEWRKEGGGCPALKSIRVIAYGTCCFLCCVVWYVLVLRVLECGVLLVQIKSFFCAGITYRCRVSLCVLKESLLKHPAASIGYICSIPMSFRFMCGFLSLTPLLFNEGGWPFFKGTISTCITFTLLNNTRWNSWCVLQPLLGIV